LKNIVYILVGLPGSGKSTYIDNKLLNNKRNVKIDADNADFNSIDDLVTLVNNINRTSPQGMFTYIDGLFLSNVIQEKLYNKLVPKGLLYNAFDVRFILFEGSNETLLYNDNLRVQGGEREKNSAVTIRNAVLQTTFLKTKTYERIEVAKYDYLKKYEMAICSELGINETLRSTNWTTGGTYGTCWDDDGPTEVSPDSPINIFDTYDFSDFTKLVEYLHRTEKLSLGNIEDKYGEKYLYIMMTDYEDESDYYGGCQSYENYYTNVSDVLEVYYREVHGVLEYNSEYIELNHTELLV